MAYLRVAEFKSNALRPKEGVERKSADCASKRAKFYRRSLKGPSGGRYGAGVVD